MVTLFPVTEESPWPARSLSLSLSLSRRRRRRRGSFRRGTEGGSARNKVTTICNSRGPDKCRYEKGNGRAESTVDPLLYT